MALARPARVAVPPGRALDAAGANCDQIGLETSPGWFRCCRAELDSPADGADPIAELTQIALTFRRPRRRQGAGAAARRRATPLARHLPARRARAVGGRFRHPAAGARLASAEQSYVVKFRAAIADGRSPSCGSSSPTRPASTSRYSSCGPAPPALRRQRRHLRPRLGRQQARQRAALRLQRRQTSSSRCRQRRGEAATPPKRPGHAYAPASKRRHDSEFSAAPEAVDIPRAREALRFTPPVDDLAVEVRTASALKITATLSFRSGL